MAFTFDMRTAPAINQATRLFRVVYGIIYFVLYLNNSGVVCAARDFNNHT